MGTVVNNSELREIQLGLLDKVLDFCRENHLHCWLYGGTLLGAVRHKGYIPWDDDIDLTMPRGDFIRFMKEFPQDERFGILSIVTSKRCCYNHAKVFDRRTRIREKITVDQELGVNIDIFPLDNLTDDHQQAVELVHRILFWQKILWIKLIKFKKDRSLGKTLILATGKLLTLPISVWQVAHKIYKMSQTYSLNTNSIYVGPVSSLSYREREIFKREWFAEDAEMMFEGRSCSVPCGWDALLTQVYGDYMTPPPVEKRSSTHNFTAEWEDGFGGSVHPK